MPPDTSTLVRTCAPADLAVCRQLLVHGSRSFLVASWLLPRRIRPSTAGFYAFCRVADDLVDGSADPAAAVRMLRDRLDRIFAGVPIDDPVDRTLHAVVDLHGLSRAPFDALVEGFAWDAAGRTYETMNDVLAYAARVASAVGVVMTQIMGVHDAVTLARACDLGAAMQLTNICRDVGSDARLGRVYLPVRWLADEGVSPSTLLAAPRFDPGVGAVVRRMLDHAETLYERAAAGIVRLPADSRSAIMAAAWIYADIGRVIRGRGYDSVSGRARVGPLRKLWLLLRARLASPRARRGAAHPPLPQAEFLLR